MSERTEWPIAGRVYKRESTQQWVLEIESEINGCNLTVRHPQPLHVRPEDVPSLPAYVSHAGEFKCPQARRARAQMEAGGVFNTEEFGFAIELAMQYGAEHIDDDAEFFAISVKDLFVLLKTVGLKRG